jgi:hypothetical protein
LSREGPYTKISAVAAVLALVLAYLLAAAPAHWPPFSPVPGAAQPAPPGTSHTEPARSAPAPNDAEEDLVGYYHSMPDTSAGWSNGTYSRSSATTAASASTPTNTSAGADRPPAEGREGHREEQLAAAFTNHEPGPPPGHRTARYAGRMFWLMWNTFSGSYRRFTVARRS